MSVRWGGGRARILRRSPIAADHAQRRTGATARATERRPFLERPDPAPGGAVRRCRAGACTPLAVAVPSSRKRPRARPTHPRIRRSARQRPSPCGRRQPGAVSIDFIRPGFQGVLDATTRGALNPRYMKPTPRWADPAARGRRQRPLVTARRVRPSDRRCARVYPPGRCACGSIFAACRWRRGSGAEDQQTSASLTLSTITS